MSSWYYFAAQLPSIPSPSSQAPLPLTDAQFLELAGRFLDPASLAVLHSISLVPPRTLGATGSKVVDTWNATEQALRLALAQVRAQKLKKDFSAEKIRGSGPVKFAVLATARTAISMDSPLSAEQYLNDFRMDVLRSITPTDLFSTEALFVYALKLKLTERMRKFNTEDGTVSYKTIYDHITAAPLQKSGPVQSGETT